MQINSGVDLFVQQWFDSRGEVGSFDWLFSLILLWHVRMSHRQLHN